MRNSYDAVPHHLQKYLVQQDYSQYTARDQAAWRYIMRQSRNYFSKNAVPVYLSGLEKTAIHENYIPKIAEMDSALREFGWGAVAVRGFIPPSVFIELQSMQILPIAADMRTVEHIAYTPAPDIVHEAAGHAPIIADAAYARYLTSYAKLARHAIFSIEDISLYEAIRVLSDTKENPDKTKEDIISAQEGLNRAIENINFVSEASQVARMYWWTAEYGLIGSLENPQIYGAGLLSSVGESRHCLSSAVKKIRLSLDCIHTSYDITEPQPQLFVAEDFSHLSEVLLQLEKHMSFVRGGVYGLQRAEQARTVTTLCLDSGLQISGVLQNYSATGENVEFIKFQGPVALSYDDKQISGHDRKRHPDGFSSPLGRLEKYPEILLHRATPSQLDKIGIIEGESCRLLFRSGYLLEGRLKKILRAENNTLLLMTFSQCKVTRGDENLFSPEWGEFDLALGESVTSVSGGAADVAAYGEQKVGHAATQPGRQTPYSIQEKQLIDLYQELRELSTRFEKAVENDEDLDFYSRDIDALYKKAVAQSIDEWLWYLECLELAVSLHQLQAEDRLEKLMNELRSFLNRKSQVKDSLQSASLVKWGLELVSSE